MTSDNPKAHWALRWSRRSALLYAMGVWTVIGYFVSRSVRFREIPPQEKKEKGGQTLPAPPPLDDNKYSRSV